MGENFLSFFVAMPFAGQEPSVAAKNQLNDLVEKIRQGDTKAEDALLRLVWQRITRLLQIKLGAQNDDWKDVRQKCCLALWQGVKDGKYDPQKASVGAYAAGIVKMEIKSYRRKKIQRWRKIFSLSLAEPEAYDHAMLERIGLLTRETDPQAELERKEQQDRMWRCLNELPEEQREVLIAYYYKGEKLKDFAKAKGLAVGKVGERNRLGRDKLRKLWGKYFPV